ncbi:uncharacterized protein LOC114378342 isoform X3 [Glycine soja]|uniref:uncharacterized protein LOC114378342 isoform X3 n=1 Tax=Glycine soja TaxID=3848 RepID=UPI00103D2270|nr:uncharacterized protein LOC114378342 isoform X3 [Glycine soja]
MHLSLSHTDPTPPQVREAANLAKEVCRSTIQSCRFVVPSHLHGHRHWSSALTFGTSRQSVTHIFFGSNFVTVTKCKEVEREFFKGNGYFVRFGNCSGKIVVIAP